MQYYGAKQLAESFCTVRKNTLLVAEDLPERDIHSFAARITFCGAVRTW